VCAPPGRGQPDALERNLQAIRAHVTPAGDDHRQGECLWARAGRGGETLGPQADYVGVAVLEEGFPT